MAVKCTQYYTRKYTYRSLYKYLIDSRTFRWFIYKILSFSPSAAAAIAVAMGNAAIIPNLLWCSRVRICALEESFLFIIYVGRSLERVTNCHHRGGRSPSLRAGGRASVLGPSNGVSAWSWATLRRQEDKRGGQRLRLNHLVLCETNYLNWQNPPPYPSSAIWAASTVPSWKNSLGTWPSQRGANSLTPPQEPAATRHVFKDSLTKQFQAKICTNAKEKKSWVARTL